MRIPAAVERIGKKLPAIGGLLKKREAYLKWCRFAAPGHYYSPIPSDEEIDKWAKIRGSSLQLGMDLKVQEQFDFAATLAHRYKEIPFKQEPYNGLRFGYNNPFYSYSDAIFLHLIIRHLKPHRIVEVGSGFSSAVILDTVEHFLGYKTAMTFIEPDPVRLRKLLRSDDAGHCTVLEQKAEEVGLEPFVSLESNDILFIDSSHVSKAGSDVNFLFFEVFPRLKPGVWIHFHDIHPGFDYLEETLRDGIAWNEAYMLHAFLLFNSEFEIILHTPFCVQSKQEWFQRNMPDCLKGFGSSIWLRRKTDTKLNGNHFSGLAAAKGSL